MKNYIAEIRAFHELVQDKQLSTGQIALWYALMYINNRCNWIEWFTVANISLELNSGLSRQGIVKARNVLKQLNVIDFRSNGTKATSYKLTTMSKSVQASLQVGVQDSIQDGVQSGLQVGCTLTKRNETKHKPSISPSNGENDAFDTFWKMYPKKVGKGAAEKAFKKYKPDDALLNTMLKAIEIQLQSEQWKKDCGQYIPNPATWLNQKRWEDEPDTGATSQGKELPYLC